MAWPHLLSVSTVYVHCFFRSHYEAMEKAYGPSDVRVAIVINDLAVHLSRVVCFCFD